MDPRGDGPPLDESGQALAARPDVEADLVWIAQASGMLMQLYGLDPQGALAALFEVCWNEELRLSGLARALVERWPMSTSSFAGSEVSPDSPDGFP